MSLLLKYRSPFLRYEFLNSWCFVPTPSVPEPMYACCQNSSKTQIFFDSRFYPECELNLINSQFNSYF